MLALCLCLLAWCSVHCDMCVGFQSMLTYAAARPPGRPLGRVVAALCGPEPQTRSGHLHAQSYSSQIVGFTDCICKIMVDLLAVTSFITKMQLHCSYVFVEQAACLCNCVNLVTRRCVVWWDSAWCCFIPSWLVLIIVYVAPVPFICCCC